MTSALTFLNDFPGISNFIPKRNKVVERTIPQGWVKILSVEPPVFIEKVNYLWSYLTLGVPLLIEKCSIIWQEVLHREQTGLALRFRFKGAYIPAHRISLVEKFHQFNEITSTPLNNPEFNKICQYMNRAISRRDQAIIDADVDVIEQCEQWLKRFKAILQKSLQPQATRSDFNREDWAVLDLVDYELAVEHFANLTKVFNSQWFKSSQFQEHMSKHFRVDYNEALIAEGLALSLAYIEGIHGKQIKLPVKTDDPEKPYRSVTYTIIEMTLGDALPCYILESSEKDAPPWFVIRGTQTYTGKDEKGKEYRKGSLESILADAIDPKEIARDVIKKSLVNRPIIKENGVLKQKKSLSEVFEGWRRKKRQVILCGHSLGGCLTNHLAVRYEKIVKNAYGFSSAGVSKKIASKWEKRLAKEVEENGHCEALKNKIVNFDYEGDFVPSGGTHLIGLHLAITPIKDCEEHGIIQKHVKCHLNKSFQIRQVDIEVENRKLSRRVCERLRIIMGICFRVLLSIFSPKNIPDWWKLRKVYKKKAAALNLALKAMHPI